jgi:hypothetical protein
MYFCQYIITIVVLITNRMDLVGGRFDASVTAGVSTVFYLYTVSISPF